MEKKLIQLDLFNMEEEDKRNILDDEDLQYQLDTQGYIKQATYYIGTKIDLVVKYQQRLI